MLTSWMATMARLGRARTSDTRLGARPAERLVLYEYESCPMCRRAREAVSNLALEVEVRPCPMDGERFRPEVEELGGKQQFPFLVDPNTDRKIYESSDIVQYLYDEYGAGDPKGGLLSPFFPLSSQLASVCRGLNGFRARASDIPAEPLELDGFEGSPQARVVREVLCELELRYVRRPGPFAFRDANLGADLREPRVAVKFIEQNYAGQK